MFDYKGRMARYKQTMKLSNLIFAGLALATNSEVRDIEEFLGEYKYDVQPSDASPRIQKAVSKPGTAAEAKYYTHYAGLAYCEKEAIEQWDCKHCASLGPKHVYSNMRAHARDTKSLLAVDHDKAAIVLAFRGTSSLRNWFENSKLTMARYIHGSVHTGFLNCADEQLSRYQLKLNKLLAEYPDYTLVVTGHSLGGAIATISAVMIQKSLDVDFRRMHLITYGQPRVGDLEFAAWMNNQPWKVTRVVNANDVVPHVPPAMLGFVHHQTEMYLHHGKVQICASDNAEDENCSNANRVFSPFPHLEAFGIELGQGGC